MFDFGWDEMAVIAVFSLIFIGPKDLPRVMREAGRWARRARELAAEFRRGVDDMVREAELAEMRQKIETATQAGALENKIRATVDPTGAIAGALAPPAIEATALPATAEPVAAAVPDASMVHALDASMVHALDTSSVQTSGTSLPPRVEESSDERAAAPVGAPAPPVAAPVFFPQPSAPPEP
jgi:sec-independent protein translocase protein TatB